MKLKKHKPNLAKELETGLREIGETALASSVSSLEIVDRCRCGDKGCGTFYTLEKKIWIGKKLNQLVPVLEGLYAIDVYEDKIACIEILDRNDVENKLNEMIPLNKS